MSGIINSFPGYEFIRFGDDNKKHNMYRGTDVGLGGYVVSKPGAYGNVALLDIASMHPNSLISMNYFGEYTQNYKDLLNSRIAIKHGDFDSARSMLDGRLAPYLNDESKAKELAQALKIACNSVYGQTAATYPNVMRHPMNDNNIVALKGALFMRTLQDEVKNRGFTIVAIRTDSIKIADATKDIIDFCMEFAKKYGYTFEHEATYDRMCQVNDADYIARYKEPAWCEDIYGYVPGDNKKHGGRWTTTGAKFAVPYVFKKLFTREAIDFSDLCETKEVSKGALYIDMNERLSEGEHDYHFIGKVGLFCPIKPGYGGGDLRVQRKNADGSYKYDSAAGCDGYRWLEAENVKLLGKENDIDLSYYNAKVDACIYGSGTGKTYKPGISDFCDFEWFVSDDPYIPGSLAIKPRQELEKDLKSPPWLMPCDRENCQGCPKFYMDEFHMSCELGYDISDLMYFNTRDEDGDAFDKR
jgi:hypothetical protein